MSIFFILCLISGVGSIDVFDEKPSELQDLFTTLKEFALPEVRALQKENQHFKQYLVTAVLTKQEFNKAQTSWTDENLSDLKNDGRVKTHINKEVEGQKKPFHGEMQFLKNDLDNMVAIVRNHSEENAVPFIVMYTHYIPCAHVNKLKYSCSEELARVASSRKWPIYVAFSEVYKDTPKDAALRYLALGNIKSYEETNKGFFTLVYTPESSQNEGGTFQSLFGNCLNNMGVSVCDNRNVEEKVLVRFVNLAVHSCTSKSKDVGMITRNNRGPLVKCLINHFQNCEGCKNCPEKKVVRFVFQFCVLSILRPGLAFGSAVNLRDNTWKRYEGPWKNVIVDASFEQLPYLPCNVRTNALNDCCETLKKLKKDDQRLPDFDNLSLDVYRKMSGHLNNMRRNHG